MKRLILILYVFMIMSSVYSLDFEPPLGWRLVTIAPTENVGTSAFFPLNYNWRTNLSQTIYFQEEMVVTAGYISHLKLYFTGHGDIPADINVSFWMANIPVTKKTFISTTDWIPFNQFTQVWISKPFPDVNLAGAREIMVELDNPFYYTGGNLVLMGQRNRTDVNYSSANVWTISTVGENRTMRVHNDGAVIHPHSPGFGTRVNGFPHVGFGFAPAGTVSGKISLPSGFSIPEEGIAIAEVGGNNSVQTDGEGYFSISGIPMENLGLRASLLGFDDLDSGVLENWNIDTYGHLYLEWNPTMSNLNYFKVSGKVVFEDRGHGSEGIQVSLTGYIDMSIETESDGSFTFERVWDQHTYELKVSNQRYYTYTRQIIVDGAEHSNLDIILKERIM